MFNLRNLDLNLLTVFEAVYELGSVSRAAKRLGLSQPATSHALGRLRDVCRDELFVRGRHGLQPTPVAKGIYPAIAQALESLRSTLAEASRFDPATSKRHFRVSIPHPMGPFYALRIKAAAADAAPGIEMNFDTVSWPVNLEEHLREGSADIAVDWLPVEMDPFVNVKVFDDRLMLVARRDHPWLRGGATIERLRQAEFIGPHRRRDIERLPQALSEFYRLGLPEVVRVSELLEIPIVVAATDLLGIFPLSMCPLAEKHLGLQVLEIPLKLPTLPIYVVWHETRRDEIAHRWLRELVVAQFAAAPKIGRRRKVNLDPDQSEG
jgi:DNA-binding transcriptional LysR family regulator